MGIPAVFAVLAILAILAEFLGSLGLIVGLFTRIAAFGIASVMVVANVTSHLGNGFFMNWADNQKGEGFEFHILALGLSLAVLIRGAGAGAGSLDRSISRSG